MSFPFGGHPTLERFAEYAAEHGCTVEIKVRARKDGQPYSVVEMTNPKGGHVVVVDGDMQERQAPSQVAYMQRRLGIKTPFAATPEETKKPAQP